MSDNIAIENMIDSLPAECIIEPKDGLYTIFKKEKRPIVKLGFDPTAPDLHLGHGVVLKQLRAFEKLGAKIIVIIGDFTARIGDPTGKNELRPPLSKQQIMQNAKTYTSQLSKILDISKVEILYNSSWYEKMNFADIIKICSNITIAQILGRKDFAKRYTQNTPICMHEILYPIMQAYDSFIIEANLEIGGTDQLFNCLLGRQLQEKLGAPAPQCVLGMPILTGLDGKDKMSKSKNNYIAITDDPENMFGKIMSISDAMLPEYIMLASGMSQSLKQELCNALTNKSQNPMEIKKILARDITATYHSADDGQLAQSLFERKVQSNSLLQEDYKSFDIAKLRAGTSGDTIDVVQLCFLLKNSTESKSAIRRLIAGGSLKIDDEKIVDQNHVINLSTSQSIKIKLGKRGLYMVH